MRLLLIAPLVVFIAEKSAIQALAVFLAIILLDIIDGFFARKLNQDTKFGNYFDTAADILFILSAAISLYAAGHIPLPAFALLLINRVLSLGSMILHYLKKGINYKPFYVKTGVASIYIMLAYSMVSQGLNIWLIYALIAYAYLIVIISYIKYFLGHRNIKN